MDHSDVHFYEDMMGLVINLQTSNSTLDKIECLELVRTNPELMSLLHYMYNPYFQYYVSWKNIKKRSDLKREYTGDIFTLLDMLSERSITGHDAIGCVNGYLSLLPKKYHWLVELIFERSLKARVDTRLINRVMPDLIPSFNVTFVTYGGFVSTTKEGESASSPGLPLWSLKLSSSIENLTLLL